MITDQDLLTSDGLDSFRELSDGSDSGLDCGSVLIKDEPPSPISSINSDTQFDSSIQVSCSYINICLKCTFLG